MTVNPHRSYNGILLLLETDLILRRCALRNLRVKCQLPATYFNDPAKTRYVCMRAGKEGGRQRRENKTGSAAGVPRRS